MGALKKVLRAASPEETIELGKRIGACLKGGEVIAFRGGLGAGKTTITRGIARGMGLEDNVSSPTFALVNEYHGEGLSLYHFDMYRISGEEALETTGFFDYMEEGGVIAVEWSENISEFLPGDVIFIDIERISDEERLITITGGENFADIGD